MNTKHNPQLTRNAQRLRREMTNQERKLWHNFLKTIPLTVKRQKVIGKYIVDFCIDKAKLIIELDGSQHYSEEGEQYDRERNAYLCNLGYTIIHYTNLEVERNFNEICSDIERKLIQYF